LCGLVDLTHDNRPLWNYVDQGRRTFRDREIDVFPIDRTLELGDEIGIREPLCINIVLSLASTAVYVRIAICHDGASLPIRSQAAHHPIALDRRRNKTCPEIDGIMEFYRSGLWCQTGTGDLTAVRLPLEREGGPGGVP
jgi:hypothetical protein